MRPTIQGAAMSRQNGLRPTASNKGWERMSDELPKMGMNARRKDLKKKKNHED